MSYEYRYETIGVAVRKVAERERVATDDLNRLAGEGWEPISVARPNVIGPIGVLLRRPA